MNEGGWTEQAPEHRAVCHRVARGRPPSPTAAPLFAALGDETRSAASTDLLGGPLPITRLTAGSGVTPSSGDQALTILSGAGLVEIFGVVAAHLPARVRGDSWKLAAASRKSHSVGTPLSID